MNISIFYKLIIVVFILAITGCGGSGSDSNEEVNNTAQWDKTDSTWDGTKWE